MQLIDERELPQEVFTKFCLLKEKINKNAEIKYYKILCNDDTYFNKVNEAIKTDRFGEVVFAVERPNGRIIVITCDEYPDGVYRIPTGGIAYGEDIEKAAFREVKEELGLEVDIISFIGLAVITFMHKDKGINFYSFLFHLRETGGRLLEDATDNEVSAIKEADRLVFEEVVQKLQCLPGKWKDWGVFRYVTTKEMADYFSGI